MAGTDGGMGDMTPMGPGNNTMPHMHKMTMHMTFFWGKNGEILFSGWPGHSLGLYILALVLVFFAAFLLELISHISLVKPGSSPFRAGLFRTVFHTVRVGLAYLVMLALMSFNGGVFLVAVAGHLVGFFLFGSQAFKRSQAGEIPRILPPMKC